MWIRFLVISFLNFIATVAAVFALMAFIIPDGTPNIVTNLAVWSVAFLLAFLFANWALSKRLPTRQSTLALIALHLAVFVLLLLAYGIFVSDIGPWIIVAPELLVQLALEVVAIFGAAWRMRRHKIQSVLGEGRTM